jgi:hypothetical protein
MGRDVRLRLCNAFDREAVNLVYLELREVNFCCRRGVVQRPFWRWPAAHLESSFADNIQDLGGIPGKVLRLGDERTEIWTCQLESFRRELEGRKWRNWPGGLTKGDDGALGTVSDIREAVAWARSANQPVYVLCTEYSSFPCGARCANPRAVHGVPIPVRCTVCQSPCAF